MIDTTACEDLIRQTPKPTYALLEKLASNNYQWTIERARPKPAVGVLELDQMSSIGSQLAIALNKRFNKLERGNLSVVQTNIVCSNYFGEHNMAEFPCRRAPTIK